MQTANDSLSSLNFKGLAAVITGGATGIGRQTARQIVNDGGSVVLVGRRLEKLQQAATDIDPSGKQVALIVGDVSQRATTADAVALAVKRFGGLDFLINNAGTFISKGFLEHSDGDLDEQLGVGIKGPFYAAQAAIPELRRRHGGSIVNVGSIIGSVPLSHIQTCALSAAKAGLHMLTRNLAQEFAADRIRVNAVAPAMVATSLYDQLMTHEEMLAELPTMNAQYPLGRIGQPDDVARSILFLAHPRNSWMTGVILPLNGGAAFTS